MNAKDEKKIMKNKNMYKKVRAHSFDQEGYNIINTKKGWVIGGGGGTKIN